MSSLSANINICGVKDPGLFEKAMDAVLPKISNHLREEVEMKNRTYTIHTSGRRLRELIRVLAKAEATHCADEEFRDAREACEWKDLLFSVLRSPYEKESKARFEKEFGKEAVEAQPTSAETIQEEFLRYFEDRTYPCSWASRREELCDWLSQRKDVVFDQEDAVKTAQALAETYIDQHKDVNRMP